MFCRSKGIPRRNWNLPGIVLSWLKLSTLNRLDLWLLDIAKPRHFPVSDEQCIAKVHLLPTLKFSTFWKLKLLFRRGNNELLEMYYHTSYSFSQNFWIVKLNQNNAFNLAAAYLTKTKGMLKSMKFCKITLHRTALLNDPVPHSEVHGLQWVEWWNERRKDAFVMRLEADIISQNTSYAVILILKKGKNFKSPLHILDNQYLNQYL